MAQATAPKLEATRCETCHMVHRADYRTYSETFGKYMSPNEFVQRVKKEHNDFVATHKNWK